MRIDEDLEERVRSLMGEGQKIEAIKLYRERTGAGLKESKDAVESLAEQRGIVISQGTGCFGVVLIALLFVAGAMAFADDRPCKISVARWDEDGLMVHTLETPYPSGKTEIMVLIRDKRGIR